MVKISKFLTEVDRYTRIYIDTIIGLDLIILKAYFNKYHSKDDQS